MQSFDHIFTHGQSHKMLCDACNQNFVHKSVKLVQRLQKHSVQNAAFDCFGSSQPLQRWNQILSHTWSLSVSRASFCVRYFQENTAHHQMKSWWVKMQSDEYLAIWWTAETRLVSGIDGRSIRAERLKVLVWRTDNMMSEQQLLIRLLMPTTSRNHCICKVSDCSLSL